ncbi:uncharacterized protein PgNI_02846, partial [Pyricularia grisea]|uniref:Uncharacterized protein n=1 Tax=Pyricularia grisea TaxID=148305 RepID=A0A6P8BAL5_PYRGI
AIYHSLTVRLNLFFLSPLIGQHDPQTELGNLTRAEGHIGRTLCFFLFMPGFSECNFPSCRNATTIFPVNYGRWIFLFYFTVNACEICGVDYRLPMDKV